MCRLRIGAAGQGARRKVDHHTVVQRHAERGLRGVIDTGGVDQAVVFAALTSFRVTVVVSGCR
ncbi:MAG: hypothetical protein R3E73_15225 [Porticoccaceae bacterium]